MRLKGLAVDGGKRQKGKLARALAPREASREASCASSHQSETSGGGFRLLASGQTLRGSFSAVSTATIARVGVFFRIFRDLQDLHSFAPLRPQEFLRNAPKCSINSF